MTDKIEDNFFLFEMFGNLAFNLFCESEAHDADISISVQFVGTWDMKHGDWEHLVDLSFDDLHIERTCLKTVNQNY